MLGCGREVGGGEEVETLFPILYKVIKTNIEKKQRKRLSDLTKTR